MPKYATFDAQGDVRWVVDLPYEKNDPHHIPVPDGHEVATEPSFWRVENGALVRRSQAEIDGILAARQVAQAARPESRLAALIAWARTMGFTG